MNGSVLGYQMMEDAGVILGADGSRYRFTREDWLENEAPQKGLEVNFTVDEGLATEIYILNTPISVAHTDDNWYKSSNSKMLAGVCSGIAHKYNVSTSVLRIVTFFSTLLLTGIPLFLYMILWIILPSKPTK